MKKVIIVFTRYPQPGKVKTRLIPQLGPQRAALLQRSLTEHIVGCAREEANRWSSGLQVHFHGSSEKAMRDWLGEEIIYHRQEGRDLGERMKRAFEKAFQGGACSVVLVGSDIPELTPVILGKALEALDTHEVVLGPALDGGYYLMGLKAGAPDLFSGIEWGSSHVFSKTKEKIERFGLKAALLETLHDVDTLRDLPSATRFLK